MRFSPTVIRPALSVFALALVLQSPLHAQTTAPTDATTDSATEAAASRTFPELRNILRSDTASLEEKREALDDLRASISDGGPAGQRLFTAVQLLKEDLAPSGRPEAIGLLTDLADGGNAAAQTVLGRLLLEEDPAHALNLLEAAVSGGNAGATLILGKVMLEDGPLRNIDRGLELLGTAAETGNKSAARQLVLFYIRDGADRPEAPKQLEALTTRFGDELPDPFVSRSKIIIATAAFDEALASLSGLDSFTPLAEAFSALPANKRRQALMFVLRDDANAYTYVVQDRLSARGLYNGPRNGQMTSSTIRAIAALCAQENLRSECIKGPLHPFTARAIAEML